MNGREQDEAQQVRGLGTMNKCTTVGAEGKMTVWPEGRNVSRPGMAGVARDMGKMRPGRAGAFCGPWRAVGLHPKN